MIEGYSNIRVENLELRQGRGHGTAGHRGGRVTHRGSRTGVIHRILPVPGVVLDPRDQRGHRELLGVWVPATQHIRVRDLVRDSGGNTIRNCKIMNDRLAGRHGEDLQHRRHAHRGQRGLGPGANGITGRPTSDRNVIRYNFVHDMNGIALQIRENSDDNRLLQHLPEQLRTGHAVRRPGTGPTPASRAASSTTTRSCRPARQQHPIFGTNRTAR